MLASLGSFTYRRRWAVLVVTLLLTIGAGGWGLGVFDKLTQSGYEDPASESMQVKEIVTERFQRPPDVVVVYTAPDGKTVDDPDFAARVTAALHGLPTDKIVRVVDYWSTGQPAPPARTTRWRWRRSPSRAPTRTTAARPTSPFATCCRSRVCAPRSAARCRPSRR